MASWFLWFNVIYDNVSHAMFYSDYMYITLRDHRTNSWFYSMLFSCFSLTDYDEYYMQNHENQTNLRKTPLMMIFKTLFQIRVPLNLVIYTTKLIWDWSGENFEHNGIKIMQNRSLDQEKSEKNTIGLRRHGWTYELGRSNPARGWRQ